MHKNASKLAAISFSLYIQYNFWCLAINHKLVFNYFTLWCGLCTHTHTHPHTVHEMKRQSHPCKQHLEFCVHFSKGFFGHKNKSIVEPLAHTTKRHTVNCCLDINLIAVLLAGGERSINTKQNQQTSTAKPVFHAPCSSSKFDAQWRRGHSSGTSP